MTDKFPRIFSEGRIGACTLVNRLVAGPMVVNLNPDHGKASEAYISYFEEKAKGGFGLILTENYCVSEHAGGFANISGIYTDEQAESHKRFTDRIHKYESKVFAQLYHAGRQSNHFVNGGVQPVSSSPIPDPFNREVPRALNPGEIAQITEDFARAAANAKKAGFDGIEIHAAHGYLLHQFLSAALNKRVDEYGGTYGRRFRFLREVLAAVRAEVGQDFPMQVRVSAADQMDGGRGSFESRQILRDIESCGADALHISFGMYGIRVSISATGTYHQELGYGAKFAAEAKKVVDIPVIASGSIHDPYMIEDILASGDADFVTLARPSLADPYFPAKLRSGDVDGIRQCLRCNQGCLGGINGPIGRIRCMVNPLIGHETEYDRARVAETKKVWVAGGGVAGMEAARGAALKGHDVSLFEKSDTLGGQFLAASYPPYKSGFTSYLAWLADKLRELGVKIYTGTELGPQRFTEEKPDKLIVATGAVPRKKEIPRSGNADDCPRVIDAIDLLLGRATAGNDVLVAGGGLIGAETTSYLATQCRASVALSTRQRDIMSGGEVSISRDDIKEQLARNFVCVYTEARLREISPGGAVLERADGTAFTHKCDTVVTAFGMEPYDPIGTELRGLCETVTVGDAASARSAFQASQEGFKAGVYA
jgi:2,4-dienoyl-CoA reductase-like NADH-dependent reductase (Old Yellow Enzyme family)/thioredoxin reductase